MNNARKLDTMTVTGKLYVLPVAQAVEEPVQLPPALQRKHRGLSVVAGHQFVADTQAVADRIVQEAEQRLAEHRAQRAKVFCMVPAALTQPEPASWTTRLRKLFI